MTTTQEIIKVNPTDGGVPFYFQGRLLSKELFAKDCYKTIYFNFASPTVIPRYVAIFQSAKQLIAFCGSYDDCKEFLNKEERRIITNSYVAFYGPPDDFESFTE